MNGAAKLRAKLESERRAGAGIGRRGYAEATRLACVEHTQLALAAGGGRREVAEALGIAEQTLGRWLGTTREEHNGRSSKSSFQRVEVVGASAAIGITVRGPRGLRVTGLDLKQLAELWRRLEG